MKKQFCFFLILVITTVSVIVFLFLFNIQTMANRQRHIFCELLKPGMSRNNVLSTLEQFGSFEHSSILTSAVGNGNFVVYMKYIDIRVVGHKTYVLTFQNDKYTGVSALTGFWQGIDNVESVCSP